MCRMWWWGGSGEKLGRKARGLPRFVNAPWGGQGQEGNRDLEAKAGPRLPNPAPSWASWASGGGTSLTTSLARGKTGLCHSLPLSGPQFPLLYYGRRDRCFPSNSDVR